MNLTKIIFLPEMQTVNIRGEELLLHPEKGVFWPRLSILFLADLHLGKGAHFRRSGIAVPREVREGNFRRMEKLLADYSPERVVLLGDLFHSHYNHVWDEFEAFLYRHASVRFELVPGNHDILPASLYKASLLIIRPGYFEVPPFSLGHHPLEEGVEQELYHLCGHIHPCVRLGDAFGRNTLRLPCFYFGRREGILPAFGEFTGCAEIKVREEDRVFVLAEGEVQAVQ